MGLKGLNFFISGSQSANAVLQVHENVYMLQQLSSYLVFTQYPITSWKSCALLQ